MENSIMKSRSKKPEAASTAHAPAHDQTESVVQIIDQIEGEAGGDGVEMMGMDAGSRKPAKATRQSPATRSSGRVRQGGVISAVAVGHRQAALAVMCRG